MNIRRHYRAARRALGPKAQDDHACAVARHVAASGLLLRSGAVGLYFPNRRDGELDTLPILEKLWSMARPVAVPVVSPSHPTMEFHRLDPGARLRANRFGILEPPPGSPRVHALTLALLFLPLVAFDGAGTRIGMGLGFYDRFLARIPGPMRPRLVGLAHDVQASRKPLPRHDRDVPLDAVVTESGWRTFPHTR